MVGGGGGGWVGEDFSEFFGVRNLEDKQVINRYLVVLF